MPGKPTSGNFTERRGRKLRRIIRLDDETARRLRSLHKETSLPDDQIVAMLIEWAARSNSAFRYIALKSPLSDTSSEKEASE